MADDLDLDTGVGFKRRISELSETQGKQPTVEEPHSSQQLSPAATRETDEIVRNICSDSDSLQKKAKCSSEENQQTLDYEGVKDEQEIGEDKFVSGSDVVMKLNDDVVQEGSFSQSVNENRHGFSGIEEFGDVKKSSTSRLSAVVKEVQMDSAVEDCNKGFAHSGISLGENESESSFENNSKQSLFDHKLESKTHIVKFPGIESSPAILGDTIKNGEKLGVMESKDIVERTSVSEEMPKRVHNEGLKGDGGDARCSLKIEVIDDTALIDTASASRVGNDHGKERGFVDFGNNLGRNCNKKNVNQEMDGKKEKMSRRRGKGKKERSDTNGNEKVFTHMVEAQKGYKRNSDGTKRVYSRKEMEVLRFVKVEEQKKMWAEVYCGLGPAVAKEYDGMLDCNHQKHIRVNFDPRPHIRKKDAASALLGEECSENMDNAIQNMNSLDPACGLSVSDVDGCTVVDEECSEDDDSDAEYSSIQRPAFLVTGVPDFNSGPPQDGLEYLRRVRWEAEQIPKVKVAKVERSKLNKEQTIYMPEIPDIAKCPEHLMPLKQWEDAFLAEFSELRLALSRHEVSCAKISGELQSVSIGDEEESSHRLLDSIVLEQFENLTVDGADSCKPIDSSVQSLSIENENDASLSPSLSSPTSFPNGSSGNRPTLSTILGMDSVGRVSMLRKRINSVETMSSLSRNDCEWLFALCAAVDTPLNGDTCAALRCLLRKCASLRAGKSEFDDEVVMLNILATISGNYFGQSEN